MTILIDRTGQIEDTYRRVADEGELLAAHGSVLVPLALLAEALEARGNRPLGVSVANRTPLEALAPHLAALSLVAIEFPSFSDGTGFSLAMRLRREGYEGRLRASGPLVADQFAEALACGFDEIELPEASAARQPAEQWLDAKDSITAHYQSGYGEGLSILEQRRAARP